ncbi:hypothetical protein [Streptomyces sp. NBC_01618]|uniref:hypothetical protein n=1 Tax=Streptomyces sp. NBC_01618 TaxID=2975900 RepID=UPI00386BB61A|nr:hypothetical protein OH735_33590 [Streptomyces sp. NBC_01618]
MSDHDESAAGPLHLVEVNTDEGREGIVYSFGPGFPVVGIVFVPAYLLAEEP